MLDRDDVRNNLTGEPETDPEEREEEVFEDEYEDWDWEDEPRKKGKKGLKILIGAAAVLVVVLVAAALWINANFVIAGGLYPRDAQALDLREKKISLKNYDKLAEELPGCDIRWNVPLGDGRYDNRSETLAVPDLSAEEVGLLAHFTDLQSLDITGAELSVAFLSRLREERIFPSRQALSQQIGRDVETAKKLFVSEKKTVYNPMGLW